MSLTKGTAELHRSLNMLYYQACCDGIWWTVFILLLCNRTLTGKLKLMYILYVIFYVEFELWHWYSMMCNTCMYAISCYILLSILSFSNILQCTAAALGQEKFPHGDNNIYHIVSWVFWSLLTTCFYSVFVTQRFYHDVNREKKLRKEEGEEEINVRDEDKKKTEWKRGTKAELHGMFLFSVNSSVVPYNFTQ